LYTLSFDAVNQKRGNAEYNIADVNAALVVLHRKLVLDDHELLGLWLLTVESDN